ncbi:BtrH N-terminal domain-containing protein [Teredinibacter sp. KSP-S5-2]|uniref:BtrH N-terminal domain-containing protein n=1 Tax=Teredinibacter sp. KSP-S5-2 TaxID=3034506 RepID=UPI0029348197|nr:BtrH N-terminal domain-containing protein [Teredinibacter sp. KSP-S5-2]WNO09231.1 BtrH N-terminal domain-containing protein [Teredinibacter sp. KSP-S5-2]
MHFEHNQSAHCETGVMSALLTHNGLPMSEAMALGLSNAVAFAYIPFIKLAGQPLISYRLPPKFIIKGLAKRLKLKINFQNFKDPLQGAEALEREVESGKLVGLQTSVYWLPYFPEEMRFHFNAHNMLVYGKKGGSYLISDPVFEDVVEVTEKDLTKARFAKGALAPKGLMYTLESMPETIDYEQHIPAAIKKNYKVMLGAPLPIIGIRGIRHLSKQVRNLSKKRELRDQKLYLGHIVRMQEEIGTGGAGFRFIYASFLEESSRIMGDSQLKEISDSMTDTGDAWRDFAVSAVQQTKAKGVMDLNGLADKVLVVAEKEKDVWRQLKSWSKNK